MNKKEQVQKALSQLELEMWGAFLELWFQFAGFPKCTEQVCPWPMEPMKHFEIVSSAHFFLQEELILNIPAGLSGDTVPFSPDCIFLLFVCFFKRSHLTDIYLQHYIA